MRNIDGREAREIASKLRLTATLLGCASQKELCAAFRRVNPQTGFDLERSYKWVQGRTLPRSPRIYEDWSAVLGLDRPGAWVASSELGEFVEAVAARHGADREALLLGAGISRGTAPQATGPEEDYICGTYACYSHAQSPYYRGCIIRGALSIEPAARRAEKLTARYSQALAVGHAFVAGPVLRGAGRALTLILTAGSSGAMPCISQLLLPAPPGSLLAGNMSSFIMVDPNGQPPYATRIAMIRVPAAIEAVEASNRYIAPEPMALTRDLAALGLRVANSTGLEARLACFLTAAGESASGTDRVSMADHVALSAACDRAWLDTLAAAATPNDGAGWVMADRLGSVA